KIISEEKKHTIRGNYELWKNRIDKINAGKAVLSIREWTGIPYRSPQRELAILRKVGLQKLDMTSLGWFIDDCDSDVSTPKLAKNDGLSYLDFCDWFRGKITIDMEPMAIIHFTDFRYKSIPDQYLDPLCERCGCCDTEWEDCWKCGGQGGRDDEDLMEEDPLWYSPGDFETCDICDGRGGWHVCVGGCDEDGKH